MASAWLGPSLEQKCYCVLKLLLLLLDCVLSRTNDAPLRTYILVGLIFCPSRCCSEPPMTTTTRRQQQLHINSELPPHTRKYLDVSGLERFSSPDPHTLDSRAVSWTNLTFRQNDKKNFQNRTVAGARTNMELSTFCDGS